MVSCGQMKSSETTLSLEIWPATLRKIGVYWMKHRSSSKRQSAASFFFTEWMFFFFCNIKNNNLKSHSNSTQCHKTHPWLHYYKLWFHIPPYLTTWTEDITHLFFPWKIYSPTYSQSFSLIVVQKRKMWTLKWTGLLLSAHHFPELIVLFRILLALSD